MNRNARSHSHVRGMHLAGALTFLGASIILSGLAHALPVTHTPDSGPNPAPFSPPFGAVNPADYAAARYIDFGVDYTGSVPVATFHDPPPAFGGVNPSGILDLLTPVNGRIVLLGTTTQGLTRSVTVDAGQAGPGTLLLEVFNLNNGLLGSQTNPTFGISTFGVTRPNSDIAYFRVSTPGNDSFGVDVVTIDTPVRVPEPATLALLTLCGVWLAWCRRGARPAIR